MGENQSTGRRNYLSATLPTTNLTWTDVGLNPSLRGDGPITNHVNCFRTDISRQLWCSGQGQYKHTFGDFRCLGQHTSRYSRWKREQQQRVFCTIISEILNHEWAGNRIPVGGEIFRTRPGRPWGPPSLLYNGYRVSLPRVKRPERGDDHPPPFSTEVKEKSTAIPLVPFRSFVACSWVNFTFTFTFSLNHPAVKDLNIDKVCNHQHQGFEILANDTVATLQYIPTVSTR